MEGAAGGKGHEVERELINLIDTELITKLYEFVNSNGLKLDSDNGKDEKKSQILEKGEDAAAKKEDIK